MEANIAVFFITGQRASKVALHPHFLAAGSYSIKKFVNMFLLDREGSVLILVASVQIGIFCSFYEYVPPKGIVDEKICFFGELIPYLVLVSKNVVK